MVNIFHTTDCRATNYIHCLLAAKSKDGIFMIIIRKLCVDLNKKKSTNVIQQVSPRGIFTISRSLPQMSTVLKPEAVVMFSC